MSRHMAKSCVCSMRSVIDRKCSTECFLVSMPTAWRSPAPSSILPATPRADAGWGREPRDLVWLGAARDGLKIECVELTNCPQSVDEPSNTCSQREGVRRLTVVEGGLDSPRRDACVSQVRSLAPFFSAPRDPSASTQAGRYVAAREASAQLSPVLLSTAVSLHRLAFSESLVPSCVSSHQSHPKGARSLSTHHHSSRTLVDNILILLRSAKRTSGCASDSRRNRAVEAPRLQLPSCSAKSE